MLCLYVWVRFKCVASELKNVSLSAGASAVQECDRARAGIVLLLLVTWVCLCPFRTEWLDCGEDKQCMSGCCNHLCGKTCCGSECNDALV